MIAPSPTESAPGARQAAGERLAVEAQGLARAFGPVRAVDGLKLTVAAGEIFGLVGPDGAGKSTTLRLLAGVLRPTAGRLTVLGMDLTADPEPVRPRIGYVPQKTSLYRDLTATENLAFFADLFRVPRATATERAADLLERTGLAPFADRLAGRLSGGMRQKLALACTLVHTPDLLLLDEPTAGVDPASRRELWAILQTLQGTGVTVVLTTQYLDEAERCHRVGMLDRGRLLAVGEPARLREAWPGVLLEVVVPDPAAALGAARSAPGVRDAYVFGDALHVAGEGDAVALSAAVQRALAGAGVSTAVVAPIAPSLEDVFVHLLRQGAPGEPDVIPGSRFTSPRTEGSGSA